MIVAVIGIVPVLTVVNAGMSPLPLDPSPIVGWSFVQVYVVMPPVLFVPNSTSLVRLPLHATWFAKLITLPVGFAVIRKVLEGPLQSAPPLENLGVTVMVATIGAEPLLVIVNAGILPFPLVASPIEG